MTPSLPRCISALAVSLLFTSPCSAQVTVGPYQRQSRALLQSLASKLSGEPSSSLMRSPPPS